MKKSPSPNRENSPSNVQFKLNENEPLRGEKMITKQYSPPRFTPDGRHLPNLNPPKPKPILKVREHSQERTIYNDNKENNNFKSNTAPLAEVEPELNITTKKENIEIKNKETNFENNVTDYGAKLKKKQVRIEEPENAKIMSDIDYPENIGITTAGNIARNRRRLLRTPIDSSDPTKCLIHHYSDIVREFGQIRKAPKTLYLNYDDLKAAAEKSEENINEPNLEINESNVNKQMKIEDNFKNKESNSGTELNNTITTNVKNDKDVEEMHDEQDFEEEKELAFLMDSPIKDLPQLMLLSEVVTKKENEMQEHDITKIAERKVRSFVDYMTDLAMFLIACWLYAFNDERLAIPILILMVYRQAKEATVSYFKRQVEKLPKLPKLPWKRNQ